MSVESATQPNPAAGRYPIAATALGLMLAGALLPTPLFELYHRTWGLSAAQISFVFAVYAGSLIPSLLFLGGISDSIGRRRTILFGLALQAVAALIFSFADGFIWLVIARIVQGFAMGIGTGAATAAIREWMYERQRAYAGEVTVIAVSAGSAVGALLGGILGQYAPYPAMLAYWVYIVLLAFIAIAVATVPSCPHLHPTATSRVLTIGPEIRTPFALAAGQSFLGWASFAIFISLVPAFVREALNLHTLLTGAVVVTAIQIGSITASIAGQKLPERPAIITALVLLGFGVWMLILAVPMHLYLLVGLSALIVGTGGGLSYMVGLNIVGRIAPPDRRAETLSAYLVVCYTGYSVPSLAVGIAATWFGLFASFFGAAVLLGMIAVALLVLTTEKNLQAGPLPQQR